MISVKVNKADPTDLYEQVAAEIRRAIADGEAKPGERLPAAKDLAAVLGVNKNTLLRSLQILRQEQLVVYRHSIGSFRHHQWWHDLGVDREGIERGIDVFRGAA